MIKRKLFEPYLEPSLEIIRALSLEACGQKRSEECLKIERETGITLIYTGKNKLTLKLLPGIRKCPATGELATTTVMMSDEVSKNYALLPYIQWHLYARENPQPEEIKLASEMSPLATRLKKYLSLSASEVAESALTGTSFQRDGQIIQFSQRMSRIIALSYVRGPLTINQESHCIIKVNLADTVAGGLAKMQGEPIQSLIDAPFMAESKGRIISVKGNGEQVNAVFEEDPVAADLWNGKQKTRGQLARKIWGHVEQTQSMIQAS